ncbi:MAG: MFS transporter [Sphingomonadales bacterium]|nr:MFS transporter [Sphingomonadales bacterium]
MGSGSAANPPPGEWRQHGRVVFAAMAGVAVSTVASYSTAVFIAPLEREFGWSRADIAGAHMIAGAATIVLAPGTGWLVDRFGARRVGIAAAFAMCGAMAGLSLTGPSIWSWRALWLFVAAAVVLIQPTVWTSGVASLFERGRGLALAVTLCGSGIGSLITPPLSYYLIEHFGWRLAFVGLGAFWAVVSIPPIVLFYSSAVDLRRGAKSQRPPLLTPAVPHGDVRTVMRSRRFLTLVLAGFCFAMVAVPVVLTLVPLLTANGIPGARAAGIASTVGFATIFGRLNIGLLLDRVPARFVGAACACVPIAGYLTLLLNPGSIPAATIAALIFGLAMGAELDILAYLVSRYFPIHHFGTLFGTIGGFVTLAGSTGPVLLNSVYDHSRSYAPALWGMIPLCAITALLLLTLGSYPAHPPAESPTA